MKLILAILVLGFCGSIYANQAVFKELAQINENPFGATVLAAVSANMRAKTPLDDISALLQQILNDLIGERTALDTYYTNTKQALTDAINENTRIRDGYQAAVNGLEQSIQTDTTSKQTKENTLTSVRGSIQSTRDRIDNLDTAYNTFITNIDADLADIANAIRACEQAIAKMQTYQNAITTSLLQVASGAKKELKSFSTQMAEMKTKLAKHGSMYGPLIHELIALTENPESDKAGKIISLLTQLLALLRQAESDLTTQRANYVNNYNTERGLAVSDLTSYEAQEVQLVSDISTLTTRIQTAQTQLVGTRQLLEDANNTLTQNTNDLAALEAHYATEGPKYDALIAIVRKIIDHFDENISSVDEWTQQQINGF